MFALKMFGLLVWFATMVWIFNDAEDNFGAGLLWVVISMFTFPLGPIAYLIMRSIVMRPAPPAERVVSPEFEDYTFRGQFATKREDEPKKKKLTDPEVEKLMADGNYAEASRLVNEKLRELEGNFDWQKKTMYKDYELMLREKSGAWD